jgi:hypothetical protein
MMKITNSPHLLSPAYPNYYYNEYYEGASKIA